MPTLDWIGKKAVVNHHQTVPFSTLGLVPTYNDSLTQRYGLMAAKIKAYFQRLSVVVHA